MNVRVTTSTIIAATVCCGAAHAELELEWGGRLQSDVRFRVQEKSLGAFYDQRRLPVGIDRNENIPTERKRVFTTSKDDQTSVRIEVLEGESRRSDENSKLGQLLLDNLRPGLEYRVEVSTESHGRRSRAVRTNIRTKPLCTSALNIISQPEVAALTLRYTPTPLQRSTFDTYRFMLSDPEIQPKDKAASDTDSAHSVPLLQTTDYRLQTDRHTTRGRPTPPIRPLRLAGGRDPPRTPPRFVQELRKPQRYGYASELLYDFLKLNTFIESKDFCNRIIFCKNI